MRCDSIIRSSSAGATSWPGHGSLRVQFFSLRYLWFNFRVYFLEPAHWSGRFPFVHDITVPPLPAGHGAVEHPFGVLTNIPLVWLALAVPLAWRGRSADARSSLVRVLGGGGRAFRDWRADHEPLFCRVHPL